MNCGTMDELKYGTGLSWGQRQRQPKTDTDLVQPEYATRYYDNKEIFHNELGDGQQHVYLLCVLLVVPHNGQ